MRANPWETKGLLLCNMGGYSEGGNWGERRVNVGQSEKNIRGLGTYHRGYASCCHRFGCSCCCGAATRSGDKIRIDTEPKRLLTVDPTLVNGL